MTKKHMFQVAAIGVLLGIIGCRGLGSNPEAAQAQKNIEFRNTDGSDAAALNAARAGQPAPTAPQPAPTPVAGGSDVAPVASPAAPAPAPVAEAPAPQPAPAAPAQPAVEPNARGTRTANYLADFFNFGGLAGVEVAAGQQVPMRMYPLYELGRAGWTVDLKTSLACSVVLGRRLTSMDFNADVTRDADELFAFNLLRDLNQARQRAGKPLYQAGDIDPRFLADLPLLSAPQTFATPILLIGSTNTQDHTMLCPPHEEVVEQGDSGRGFRLGGRYVIPDRVQRGDLVMLDGPNGLRVAAIDLTRFRERLVTDAAPVSFNIRFESAYPDNRNWQMITSATMRPEEDSLNKVLTFRNGVDMSPGPLVLLPRLRGDNTHQIAILPRALHPVDWHRLKYGATPEGNPGQQGGNLNLGGSNK